MSSERLFFDLLQVAVGNLDQLSTELTPDEWKEMKRMADKQSLTGIVLHGIEKLPQNQRPPKSLLLEWIGKSVVISNRNRLVAVVCQQLVDSLSRDGFDTCILKGLANHAYYREELGLLRSSGDVDIWVMPKDKSLKHPIRRVLHYLYRTYEVESLCWLHAELKPIDSVPVEVHLRPSFFNSPIRNRRFLNLFDFSKCVIDKEINGLILPVLRTEYEIIFQMNHLFRHLLDEGIGLRQVLDYYYLLRNVKDDVRSKTEDIKGTLRYLGMTKFASALMWVLHEVFAMPEDWMICEPSEKDGCFLLDEMMLSGNFGKYDTRLKTLEVKKGKLSYQLQRTARRISRNMRFLRSYPEEVVWEPVARCGHFLWRKFHLWKFA